MKNPIENPAITGPREPWSNFTREVDLKAVLEAAEAADGGHGGRWTSFEAGMKTHYVFSNTKASPNKTENDNPAEALSNFFQRKIDFEEAI